MKPSTEKLAVSESPKEIRAKDPCEDSWRHRMSFRLMLGLLLLFALFSLSAYLAMHLRGREVIAEQSDKLTREVGRKLVLQLQEHIEASEALARTAANLGEILPHDVALYKNLLPKIINLENKRALIAGGGIWPEPDQFIAGVARRSFFWGRNREGVLEYYDDYNTSDGPGYHREEWYEPARHVQPGQVYWSKSYMDPYSFEPMVTCTAPMHRDGKFSGVATIDLKLNGIGEIMGDLARETGGYAFVVDRNNNFICFPDASLASSVHRGTDGKIIQEQRDASSVAKERHEFSPVADLLDQIDHDAQKRTIKVEGKTIEGLIQTLRERINDLSEDEARRIAIGLLAPEQNDLQVRPIKLNHDVILHEKTQMLLYEMPSTHWKVALAMPVRQTQAVVDTVIERVAVFLLIVSLTVCVAAWLYFRNIFLRPLTTLTLRLRELAEKRDHQARLPVQGRDELARLAYWFNVRTDMLEQAYVELREQSVLINEARLTAERADRSKNIFLASMSHELRTPLNAIIGMSAFIQGTKLDEEQADYARTIHSSSNALLNLVNDIMDFSKIEAGQLELEKTDFDLHDILDEVSDILAYAAAKKSLSFHCLLDPASDGWLRGDSGRIRQIITNLATNAVKFTRHGEVEILGRITDEDSPLGLKLSFTVRDTGIGIGEESRERMFKPYSQAVSSTTRLYGGSGLGLAICKQLCLLMHGDIDFTSILGEGTTFRVHIRLEKADPLQRPPTLRLSTPGEWHCFVVDPHAQYGDILSRQIAQWGIPSTQVSTLEALPKQLKDTPVNSFLIIFGMDEHTYPGARQRLRDATVNYTTKTILHLPTTRGGSTAELSQGDYEAFVPRPLRTAQMARTIATVLGSTAAGHLDKPTSSDAKILEASTALILVVEDNTLNQKVILKMLRNLGYQYELAEDGAQAVDFAAKKAYDLILMDWHMPVMDGLEATRHIRQLGGRHVSLPIIALTASALQNERAQCFTAGMNDYLSKPVTQNNLKVVMQKWLVAGAVVTPASAPIEARMKD